MDYIIEKITNFAWKYKENIWGAGYSIDLVRKLVTRLLPNILYVFPIFISQVIKKHPVMPIMFSLAATVQVVSLICSIITQINLYL